MSWNERLYLYAQEHGGQYFGTAPDQWLNHEYDGVMLLPSGAGEILVSCVSDPHTSLGGSRYASGRYAVSHYARAVMICTLERRYALSISPKNMAQKGLDTVLKGADKLFDGLNRLLDGKDDFSPQSPEDPMYRDYGYPAVTAGRAIRTDDEEFTQTILRDAPLRRVLEENPRTALEIKPMAPGGVEDDRHLILVEECMEKTFSLSMDHWELDCDDFPNPQRKLAALKTGNFAQNMDALIAAVNAAHQAATLWRMPQK